MAEGSASGNSSSSKSLMWMMVALFAGLALLLGTGVFFAGRVIKAMGLSASASKEVVRTPNGSLRVERETQVGPGLPVYPRGSLIVPDDADARERIKEAQENVDIVMYQTIDTRDLVDAWYQKHLSAEFTRHDAGEKATPEIYKNAHIGEDDIAFVAEREDKVRVVTLALEPNGTRISLVRLHKPGSAAKPSGEQVEPATVTPAVNP
jgi:hypothetical protein